MICFCFYLEDGEERGFQGDAPILRLSPPLLPLELTDSKQKIVFVEGWLPAPTRSPLFSNRLMENMTDVMLGRRTVSPCVVL